MDDADITKIGQNRPRSIQTDFIIKEDNIKMEINVFNL